MTTLDKKRSKVKPDASLVPGNPTPAPLSKRKAISDAANSIHQLMGGLHDIGLITQETMRTFDAGCLEPTKDLAPDTIASIRRAARMSQPVFAAYLGTTKSTVAKWESGEKKPSGPSRRLLEVVAKHGVDILS